MKKLSPLLLLLLLAFACKKTNNIPSVQISQMPLKGGDSWSYAVTNYPATQTDTAVYQIAQASSVFGGTVTYYTTTSIKGVVVDSGSINVTNNTITYIGDDGVQTYAGSGLFDNWVLTFPLSSSSLWAGTGANIKVTASGQNLTVGGNNYTNVYTMVRTSITPGGMVTDTLLISPGIGIVKYDGFPLVSYHLN